MTLIRSLRKLNLTLLASVERKLLVRKKPKAESGGVIPRGGPLPAVREDVPQLTDSVLSARHFECLQFLL